MKQEAGRLLKKAEEYLLMAAGEENAVRHWGIIDRDFALILSEAYAQLASIAAGIEDEGA